MARGTFDAMAESSLGALFRSPFLVPSIALHFIAFYLALGVGSFPVNPEPSIPIQLLDVGTGNSLDKSIGPGHGPGGKRALPKLGTPVPPRQRTGKLDSGSLEATTPKEEPAPPHKPAALPGPKVLADIGHPQPMALKETSADSLVQLPVKESARQLAGAVSSEEQQKGLAALKGISDGAGIKALKEGLQVPGALKGTGPGAGPYGVPGGSPTGVGMSGGGTGKGTGGGGRSGLQGKSLAKQEADYSAYLTLIKQRVQSVWKYPDGITGVQKVTVRFTLDKAGKLSQADVMDSSDSKLNSSALEAMRKASPFPPMPESLQYLAGEPLIIRFTVSIRVRG